MGRPVVAAPPNFVARLERIVLLKQCRQALLRAVSHAVELDHVFDEGDQFGSERVRRFERRDAAYEAPCLFQRIFLSGNFAPFGDCAPRYHSSYPQSLESGGPPQAV